MKKSSPRRRTDDRERARHKIIGAAAHLFASRGLEDVTYGDIAKRSRLSRPLVYFYFPTMEELIQETFLTSCERLQERFVQAIATAPDGAAALEAIGRAYIQFHDDCPDDARLMLLEGAHCPDPALEMTSLSGKGHSGSLRSPGEGSSHLEGAPVSLRLLDQKKQIIALVASQVERGRKDGTVRKDGASAIVIALNLWAFTHGLGVLRGQLGWAIEAVHGVALPDFLAHGFKLITDALAPRA